MSEVLRDLSNALGAIVESGGPAVVRVEGRRRGPSSGVVWSADGVVVTACHVLEREEGIEVGLPDGRSLDASLVGRDPTTDVAVLRVPASGLSTPAWADGSALRVGHLVLGLSRPGRTARASLGVVSALGDAWRASSGGRIDRYVQTDLDIHIGFSGGLLVDASGLGAGMNTTGLMRGHSLALPLPTLKRVVESLLAHGRIRRGFLGIGTYPARLPAGLESRVGQPTALLVVSVEPDAPAARAGLLLGDALLSLGGQRVRHPGELLAILEEDRIGQEVAAKIVRAGEVRDVPITIGLRP
jgi:S1-C subfamily serine protease